MDEGNDEERVRMNVTPAERRGYVAKTASRTPLAWLLFSVAFFFLFCSSCFFLICRPPFHPPRVISSTAEHLTHGDGSLRNVPGRAPSLLVSLAVPRKRATQATTICHFTVATSLQPRVRSSCTRKKIVGSINEIICMPRVHAAGKKARRHGST